MPSIGKSLIVMGLLLVAAGVLLLFADRLPFRLGRLPGDIVYEGKNTKVYFPIVTSILLSVLLSLIMYFLRKR